MLWFLAIGQKTYTPCGRDTRGRDQGGRMGLFGRKKAQPEKARHAATVDLREHVTTLKLEFGLPTPCPACNQAGYLDSIDLTERRMYQHCPACVTKWET